MISTWETEKKRQKSKKMGKNGSKWLKIVQFYPLKSPGTPIYEFCRAYGYCNTLEDTKNNILGSFQPNLMKNFIDKKPSKNGHFS